MVFAKMEYAIVNKDIMEMIAHKVKVIEEQNLVLRLAMFINML